ncbi:Uncharacterised protein [Candidatus Tiddalikarchaeum anstoanum]|nr:Uncharacterised protein [Candidatus Tiddalikarchaeum anstoanum]
MVSWIFSFVTALITVYAIYTSMRLKNARLRIVALIAFSLLLIGETFDILAGNGSSTILAVFVEVLEMFITIGFFALLYYLKLLTERKKARKRKGGKR